MLRNPILCKVSNTFQKLALAGPDCPSILLGAGPSTLDLSHTYQFSTKIRDFNINYVTPKMHYFGISLC